MGRHTSKKGHTRRAVTEKMHPYLERKGADFAIPSVVNLGMTSVFGSTSWKTDL